MQFFLSFSIFITRKFTTNRQHHKTKTEKNQKFLLVAPRCPSDGPEMARIIHMITLNVLEMNAEAFSMPKPHVIGETQ